MSEKLFISIRFQWFKIRIWCIRQPGQSWNPRPSINLHWCAFMCSEVPVTSERKWLDSNRRYGTWSMRSFEIFECDAEIVCRELNVYLWLFFIRDVSCGIEMPFHTNTFTTLIGTSLDYNMHSHSVQFVRHGNKRWLSYPTQTRPNETSGNQFDIQRFLGPSFEMHGDARLCLNLRGCKN